MHNFPMPPALASPLLVQHYSPSSPKTASETSEAGSCRQGWFWGGLWACKVPQHTVRSDVVNPALTWL